MSGPDPKRRCIMNDCYEDGLIEDVAEPTIRPEHGVKILQGLNHLKRDKVLCDVTLIAEAQRFDVHKVILVSCSDYFRSMFTSGMKESTQREIELKGVTARGLDKVLEIVYTSSTTLDGDDIFDVTAAATHLQVTPVIEFCEKNFLSGMTTGNFYDFITTAKLYNMNNALKQIDSFISQNLMQIALEGTLHLLTYDQILSCLSCDTLKLKEIDLFQVAWEWIRMDQNRERCIVALMTNIRFPLISPADLVQKVQSIDVMMNIKELREMVLEALNYHVVPHSQPLHHSSNTHVRSFEERLISVGGREIHPFPGLHDEILVYDAKMSASSLMNRRHMASLPHALSHMQVVVMNNFLYVMGGCTTQCAHGESATNSVMRYDPRFDAWFQVAPMINKRAYFYSGALNNKLFAIGGKYKEGSLASGEMYDPADNSWTPISAMPTSYHAHAGAVYGNHIFVSGGYSSNHFTPDMQRYDPTLNQWEDMTSMLSPRAWHVMCIARDRLFVFGGCNLNANQQAQPVMQSECYDPDTDQWTVIAPMSISHKEASCVVFQNSIFVLGGYNVQTKTGQKMVSKYDLTMGTWETLGALPRSMTGVGHCVLKLPWYLDCVQE
ncbi:kelch-like protein 13 [Lingula anatina]|uniref:Kelch-like protein 13 n=1 Tax=Lingula anatina TaxID=7574 RepID=A0A1S3IAE4_LINAN|nr:kelch-like protein 13 [Lingula anatina]XP_013398720.1 kelch-like protein 13 [Lingula anatina]|eukprot:XP_013394379.1 kelch-like protein 13 [Lingula anatina]